MKDTIIIKTSEEDYLEKALKYIKDTLIKRKVSKANAIRAELLSEETIILLAKNAAPGVPGSALICIGVLLGQIGVPVEAIGLILPVNPLVDMFDTMNNTTGDMAGTLLVAKSEKLLDIDIYNS